MSLISGRHQEEMRRLKMATRRDSAGFSRRSLTLGRRIRLPPRIRVRLPPVDNQVQNLEFSAGDAGCSSRVIVRLERLMGSDRIRITDSRFLSSFLHRLEEEEEQDWLRRRNTRVVEEEERFRRLALDGLIEPTPEMEDLVNHPVFRVNRMIERLQKIDAGMLSSPGRFIPPVEPFPYKGDLSDFPPPRPNYPNQYHQQIESVQVSEGEEAQEEEIVESSTAGEKPRKMTILEILEENARINANSVRKEVRVVQKCEDVQDEDGRIVTRCEEVEVEVEVKAEVDPLPQLQQRLGIPLDVDLRKMFGKYRSEPVDLVFEEQGQELFERGQQVIDAYSRQSLYAQDFLAELNQMN